MEAASTENFFNGASFGDKFRTVDNTTVVFLGINKETGHIEILNQYGKKYYVDNNGKAIDVDDRHSIKCRWKEQSKKLYVAHIINEVVRQGEHEYHKVPLFNPILYAGPDFYKAHEAITKTIYTDSRYCRYEELDDTADDFFQHEYAFRYIPKDEEGHDMKLPEGCKGEYFADVEKVYINE